MYFPGHSFLTRCFQRVDASPTAQQVSSRLPDRAAIDLQTLPESLPPSIRLTDRFV